MRRPVFVPVPTRIISSSVNTVPSNSTLVRRERARLPASSRRRPGGTRAAGRAADFHADIAAGAARCRIVARLPYTAGPFRRSRTARPHPARESEGLARRTACRAYVGRERAEASRAPRTAWSAVAWSAKGWRSRRFNRPAIWSISPPVSTTAAIGLPRFSPRACSSGVAAICARRSGAALRRIQLSPSADAREARAACARHARITVPGETTDGQRQFHWG